MLTKLKMKESAEYLIKNLKKENIIVQFYESKTTSSIYMKLDYGVLNSLRISDHEGKGHLSYKYNLLSTIQKPTTTKSRSKYGVVTRHFYPLEHKTMLLKRILADRKEKLSRYGIGNYQRYMKENLSKNSSQKGFWRNSKVV